LCVAVALFSPRRAFAFDDTIVIEIDENAESALDPRVARRLIGLELADLDMRAPNAGLRRNGSLFFRVLGQNGDLRVELWDRGEFHGARLVSGSNAKGQLAARRVALAAAELARRLQKKRLLAAAREQAQALKLQADRDREARRTLDGPLALRASAEAASIGGAAALLVGPRTIGEFGLARQLRLDLGGAWLSGATRDSTRLEWFELSLSPSRRFALGNATDLDLGFEVAAATAHFSRVLAVDAIAGQHETWSSRAAVVARFEPRISRNIRLSLGAAGGMLLRALPFTPVSNAETRLAGAWLSFDLGVIVTPG
jgi:hypothetical protein